MQPSQHTNRRLADPVFHQPFHEIYPRTYLGAHPDPPSGVSPGEPVTFSYKVIRAKVKIIVLSIVRRHTCEGI